MTLDDALAALSLKFRDRCGRDAQALRRLLGEGQGTGEAMLRLAHSLAGAGATFGFPSVSAAGRQVEHALKRAEPGKADFQALLVALDACASGVMTSRPPSTAVPL